MESCLSPSPNGSKCSLGSYEGQSWKEGKTRQSQKGRTWMSLSGTTTLLHPCPWSFWPRLPLPIYGESCVWLRRLYAKAVMTYIFKIALHSPQSWAEAITEGGGLGWLSPVLSFGVFPGQYGTKGLACCFWSSAVWRLSSATLRLTKLTAWLVFQKKG